MKVTRILALIFLLLAGYGLGVNKPVPTVLSIGMIALMIYAEKKFSKQDAEWEKDQRIKQQFILASETMLGLHQCETSVIIAGMQVHD